MECLLDGAVVAEIEVSSPKLNFVNASEKEGKQQASQSQVEPSENWTDVVKDLVPISRHSESRRQRGG